MEVEEVVVKRKSQRAVDSFVSLNVIFGMKCTIEIELEDLA